MRLEGLRIAFICPSRFSLGETYNALRIAAQLVKDADVAPFFVVSKENEWYGAEYGFPIFALPQHRSDNGAWLGLLLSGLKPDLLVIADHSNLALERTSLNFTALRSIGIPLVAVDSLQFAPGPRTVSYSITRMRGAQGGLRKWFPPTLEIPALPPDVSVVTPSPVASLSSAFAPFALYEAPPTVTTPPSEIRERLAVPSGSLLVVAAQSGWASSAFEHLSLGRTPRGHYNALRTERLVRALEETGRPVTLVGIGGKVLSASASAQTTLRALPPLSGQSFTDLLAAADLYMTDNLISGAMAQAALLGTPVLALTNPSEHIPRDDDPLDTEMAHAYPGFGFPYLVNPFGWQKELEPVLRDNPYLSAVPQAPVYSRNTLSAAIDHQLSEVPDLSPTRALQGMLSQLPTATHTLASTVANVQAISNTGNQLQIGN